MFKSAGRGIASIYEPSLDAGATRLDEDIADKLPPAAAAKFRALRDEAEMARAAYLPAYRAAQEVRQTINDILARVTELQSRDSALDDRHPLIAKELGNVEALRARLRVLNDEYASKRERAEPFGRLMRRATEYVDDIRDPSRLTMAPEAPAPKVGRASDISAEIEKTRSKIAKLKDERASIKSAPIPSVQAKTIVTQFVEMLAANGRPDLWPTIEGGQFPILARDDRAMQPGMTAPPVDALGLVAWAFRDQLVSAFSKAVDEDADDSAALSSEDRKTRLEGIDRELLALERQDEALVVLARENLIHIARREDQDIRALLGLSDAAPGQTDI